MIKVAVLAALMCLVAACSGCKASSPYDTGCAFAPSVTCPTPLSDSN